MLLLKYLRNDVSENEIVRVLDWLDEGPSHRRQLDELDYINNIHILTGSTPRQSVPRRTTPVWKRALKWSAGAAAALLLCVAVGYLFVEGGFGRRSGEIMTINVPPGQRMSVTLADGTLVWLNSGTTLEYPSVFARKHRRVRISGEALFEVEHDARRPFFVETFAGEVEVLGTRFNVASDAGASHFMVSLLEGSLRVSAAHPDAGSVILAPDEIVELVDGELRIGKISDHDNFLWISGILNLDNLSFGEVLKKFEKYYGFSIAVETDSVPQVRYNGKIKVSNGIDYALNLLQMTSDFSYDKDDETSTVYIR